MPRCPICEIGILVVGGVGHHRGVVRYDILCGMIRVHVALNAMLE